MLSFIKKFGDYLQNLLISENSIVREKIMELKLQEDDVRTSVNTTDTYAYSNGEEQSVDKNQMNSVNSLENMNQNSNIEQDDSWLYQNAEPYANNPKPMMTKNQLYKSIELHRERTNITIAAIVIYVLAISNIVISSMLYDNVLMYVDSIFLIGLGIGIQFKRSRVCAGILMGYAVINFMYILITLNSISGWKLLFAGAYALKGTLDFHTEWKLYCKKMENKTL